MINWWDEHQIFDFSKKIKKIKCEWCNWQGLETQLILQKDQYSIVECCPKCNESDHLVNIGYIIEDA